MISQYLRCWNINYQLYLLLKIIFFFPQNSFLDVLWRSYWWCQILWSFVWPWFWFILCTEWHRECIWRGSQQAVMTWNSPFIFILFELHTCLYIGFYLWLNPLNNRKYFFFSFIAHSIFCLSLLSMSIPISEFK